jgi:hypothetical protein
MQVTEVAFMQMHVEVGMPRTEMLEQWFQEVAMTEKRRRDRSSNY